MIASLAVSLLLRTDLQSLNGTLKSIEHGMRLGHIGVGIADLSTGETFYYRGDEMFPMQSVFKFPLGIAVLDAVDHQLLRLDEKVVVGKAQLSVPMSLINERFYQKGAKSYTIGELLQLAVGSSDNTAADLLLTKLGGPSKVVRRLRALGVTRIRIDRPERELQVDVAGLGRFRPELTTESGFTSAMNKVSPDDARKAAKAIWTDPRDTATPRGMVSLLTSFTKGRLLSKSSQQLLWTIMTKSTTGADRLRAALPNGATLTHKTGTSRDTQGIAAAVNDVGIVTFPNGKQLAIVIFLKSTAGTSRSRDAIIAQIAKQAIAMR